VDDKIYGDEGSSAPLITLLIVSLNWNQKH